MAKRNENTIYVSLLGSLHHCFVVPITPLPDQSAIHHTNRRL